MNETDNLVRWNVIDAGLFDGLLQALDLQALGVALIEDHRVDGELVLVVRWMVTHRVELGHAHDALDDRGTLLEAHRHEMRPQTSVLASVLLLRSVPELDHSLHGSYLRDLVHLRQR